MHFNIKIVALAATLLGVAAQDAPATNPNAPTNNNDAPADIGEEPPTVQPVPFNGDSEHLPTHPDFFPTPETPGTGAWAGATGKARDLVYSLSIEERVNITTGVGWGNGPCVGNIAPIRDVFPGLCLQDGPLGVRQVEQASAFPAGINVAAAFDKDLAYQRGVAMGTEFKEKGAQVALSPSIDFGRSPTGGRNWEGFGADPYLQGELGFATVTGLQDAGVQATAKHYFVNNQEHYRYTASSNVDDRAIREIYLHPYLKAIQANVASVMCSYNRILQSWACENSYLLNGVLKHELGFQGYVQSDWQAQYSGTPSALAGLDMSMPGDSTFYSGWSYFGGNLTEAVANNTVPEERVNDMATRIVAAWYLLGQDQEEYPGVNFNFFDQNDPTTGPVRDVKHDHASLIKELGSASTVLLKNEDGALPLNGNEMSAGIAVVGSGAGPALKGPNGCADRSCVDGTVAMGWGSGAVEFPYLVDPLSALEERGALDGFSVDNWLNNWDIDNEGFKGVVSGKEAAIVFVNSDSGEQYLTVQGNEGDRNNLTAWNNGDEVVKATAALNENTVVVIHAPGQLDVEEWVEHPNVTAVLWAGFPGQESGNSITDVLFGYFNPSGKLPFTIAKQREDYGTEVVYHDSSPVPQINYTESIFVDYRHFQQENIEPRYPFGHGLSYTTFELGGLEIEQVGDVEHDEYDPEMFGASVQDWLHDPAYKVSVDVTNTGEVYGAEIVQLYLQFPRQSGEPPLVLRDFAKVPLAPGDMQTVDFTLSIYDLSTWNNDKRQWVKPSDGLISVVVGTSSEDERIVQSL